MTEVAQGYVIINNCHPTTRKKQFLPRTFRVYKKDCIADFIKSSSEPWKYWYRKWNYRCVKAESIVTVK